MRVLHIGLASHYTEGMAYQDNILPDMNIKDGHEVVFITDTYQYKNGSLVRTEAQDRILENGMRLIRVEYETVFHEFISVRIQKVRNLKNILVEIRPDTIMYHGLCGYGLLAVADYVKEYGIPFYVDSHADFTNTAKTPLAKFAYKYIHGCYVRKAIPYISKVLYLSKGAKDYLKQMYHLPDSLLEFYPLGGILQDRKEQEKQRKKYIGRLHLPPDTLLFSHSGKLSKEKKTAQLIRAFIAASSSNMHLLIFGSIPKDQKKELVPLIKKEGRVHFLGWKSGQDIIDILNATDLYLQPGSQSATSQIALCCGCAEVVAPTPSYKEMYGKAVIYADSQQKLERIFRQVSKDAKYLERYKKRGRICAEEKLDYRKLARRYLN